jgi:hypothetical protein
MCRKTLRTEKTKILSSLNPETLFSIFKYNDWLVLGDVSYLSEAR